MNLAVEALDKLPIF
jgi:hypothetical protein